MKVSVVIPAYNASTTIDAAVESVLAQTAAPDEILVMDDGSTDGTFRRLEAFQPKIRIFRQSNRGVAYARNVLCQRAQGDVIAFLDSDDIWHPRYLQTQLEAMKKHPDVAAAFTGHVNFHGPGTFSWDVCPPTEGASLEVIEPLCFFERYNRCPGPFGSPSFCCVSGRVLAQMGPEPFPVEISGGDDFYLMNVLPHYGAIAFTPASLVAYRETPGSISSNRLRSVELAVNAFELLAGNCGNILGPEYVKAFNRAFACKRRLYAKHLMGAGRTGEARRQLQSALATADGAASLAKSAGLLFATYLPAPFHPGWPASYRLSESLGKGDHLKVSRFNEC
jgi:glycosyltransferase involved in cell wall biosynthesis